MLKGYIVSQEWANNSYILHINPLLRIVPEKDEIERHEPLRETWRTDLQLLSDYLDFKVTLTAISNLLQYRGIGMPIPYTSVFLN